MFSSQDQEDRVSLSRKVQALPNDPQARQKLGIFLMQQGEVVEGLDQLARAAVLYEKDGFASKAIAVLRQMLKHDPRNNDFQKWLIRLLAQEGLSSDAQAELRKVASDSSRFTSDEQRLDFFRQTAEFLKKNPLPRLYICDILRGQKKLHEAVNELEKAIPQTASSGMYAEFAERLRAVVFQAGDDLVVLEPCGFLWLAVGMPEEGLPILDQVAEAESANGDPGREATVREVLDAIRGGWDVAAARVFSFTEAARKRAEPEPAPVETPPSPPEPPEPPPEAPEEEPSSPAETAEGGGYEQEESIVRSALGRLQAKVDEEIGDTDLEARYNLGIAYKEMGLLDEAVTEFRLAMRKPELFVGAGSLLADTLADRADFDGALAVLEAVLATSTGGEEVRRDVRYHKAVLLSKAGRRDEAQEIFRDIQEKTPGYRDVVSRLHS
ncbi:lipopolysaccharide assembly protein LapB [Candidatus Deferrimicrobium sp.]|uniref:tetratricopeptide repeat protein n=1 Tax=Candidatus Deferrimicrobium sp. TaxID=3060586 RepID=UPI002722C869|nr:tetratricopeptide repeat protein [Candidatus Deferrimicrobium sp.]MDO8738014.1 tetratricopeptide repeat protein [Candidatus Deferrimicrobium sp.]